MIQAGSEFTALPPPPVGHTLGGAGSSWLQHGALPPNAPIPGDAACALSSQEGRNSGAQDL